jgi:hypothetical protein
MTLTLEDEIMSEPAKPFRPRCIYLTCKSMQVWGEDFENAPEFQAGMDELTCTQTFRNRGPDGADVTFDACCDLQRACFREY